MSDPARPHWVFALALIPAAAALWLITAPSPGSISGLLELACLAVAAYLASLLFTMAAAGAMLGAWGCMLEIWDMAMDLLGLRRSRT